LFNRLFAGRAIGGDVGSPKSVTALMALCGALMSERGEVSGAKLAGEVVVSYRALGAAEREAFFDLLARSFGPDAIEIDRAAESYRQDRSPSRLMALQRAVESPRQELFRRWNMAPDGTGSLVALRQGLIKATRHHPNWAAVDAELLHLFRSWFNRGFLALQRIDWHTSAYILERLIQYEAVHQIQGWGDLRRRLEGDRRCYAFFHPALPDEPLVFIEIALTREMATSVQPLLDPESPIVDPRRASHAIFYSITSCQEGLRGVSFGHLLIKQVVEVLEREFPRLRTFATLSPVPGFVDWLTARGLTALKLGQGVAEVVAQARNGSLTKLSIQPSVRDELMASCAWYLAKERADPEGIPADAVARFHLANGATLERLNWGGDQSGVGIRRSVGITANYVYRPRATERNHEMYVKTHRVLVGADVERLLRRSQRMTESRRRSP
jgi:malonyl-CoA decarboxylase